MTSMINNPTSEHDCDEQSNKQACQTSLLGTNNQASLTHNPTSKHAQQTNYLLGTRELTSFTCHPGSRCNVALPVMVSLEQRAHLGSSSTFDASALAKLPRAIRPVANRNSGAMPTGSLHTEYTASPYPT